MVEVKVPEVGESITEGVLAAWLVKDGDYVEMDAELFELETDKVTVTINAESAGRIELLAQQDEDVEVGQVVAKIDDSAEKSEESGGQGEDASQEREESEEEPGGSSKEPPPEDEPQAESDKEDGSQEEEERPGPKPVEDQPPAAAGREGGSSQLFVPPSVRRMIREYGIDPQDIEKSGDRLSKSDVIRHLNLLRSQPEGGGEEGAASRDSSPQDVRPAADRRQPGEKGRRTRSKMSSLRKRIAERLVQAQQSAAILTTFNEADLTHLMAWRERHKQSFEEKFGVKLGFMSFFVKAAVDALKTVPEVNRQIEGEDIIENHYFDIGIAVSSERGLVVPVLREADRLSFAEIETEISQLARKVREKKISLDELSGGVFTISNGGVFGSLLSTPILNPPQSGVLGMHSIQRRPVAVGDSIEIRPMMYLAMSYDHRIIDGREAVTFLKRICQCVEDPERMMLEI